MNKSGPASPRKYPPAALVSACLMLGFLGLYALTSSGTVVLDHDDSAEFQTVGVIGGIPHQPYPLWCILARIFSFLPAGEPAFRITLLSIVLASLSVGLLYIVLFETTGGRIASAFASLAFGLSYTFWQNAVVAEVYALNTFLLLLVLLGVGRLTRAFSLRAWFLSVFLLGLLFSHHQLNGALLPALGYLLVTERHRWRGSVTGRRWIGSVLLLLTPFSLYMYTYLVDRSGHPMNWLENYGRYLAASRGADFDASGHFLERLRFQMSVGRLGPLFPSPGEFLARVFEWGKHVATFEFPLTGTLLSAVGFAALLRKSARRGTFWLLVGLAYGSIALTVNQGYLRLTYSIPVFVVLSLYLAEGFLAVDRAVVRLKRGATLVMALIAASLVLLPLYQLTKWTPRGGDRRTQAGDTRGMGDLFWHLPASNEDGKLYGETVSKIVPEKSLVVASWPEANVLFYHKYVKKTLQGIRIAYLFPRREYIESRILEALPDEVYLTVDPTPIGFETERVIPVLKDRYLYRIRLEPAHPSQVQ